jgi:acyl-CoA reductase-like NAD-dependent aldehyde dehydrogenase
VTIAFRVREDPATGKEIGNVPEMGVEETKEAIKHADAAFKSWTKTTGKASSAGLSVDKLLTSS